MFLVQGSNEGAPVVVHLTAPLLVILLKVMTLPKGNDLGELYRTLLVWNATDVVHGAYGIEEEDLIISDTLELETLDFPELQASLESVQMAASSHVERIKALANAGQEG
jgi:hypothetical protein